MFSTIWLVISGATITADLLPQRAWFASRTIHRAEAYARCRIIGVGGVLVVDSPEQARSEFQSMLYNQRAKCRAQRTRLLTSLDKDARRAGHSIGEAELVLDQFELRIDDRARSLFSFD